MKSVTASKGFAGNMALQKSVSSCDAPSLSMKLSFPAKSRKETQPTAFETIHEPDVDIDLREIYFLIMHFLSSGPCHRTYGQLWNELLEHDLLPRRYHARYSRNGIPSGDENDDGLSFPLSYSMLVDRYPHIEKDHLMKLLRQLILHKASPSWGLRGENAPNAADVPTLLGTGSFSLLSCDKDEGISKPSRPPAYMRWPHMKADQVRGLSLREIGGGFSRHQRAPSVHAACYVIAKPSTMVRKMDCTTKLRGHRNAVYCAIFDRLGRYVVTGSDDRLVKIWSMETAYCLASCRGHEGDITDLAVSSNNAVVASSSNDCVIRVWRMPDGLPVSVLRGHTGAVTAIAFSPRPGFQLLSSSDDGTCRIWDARNSIQHASRIYSPRPSDSVAGRNDGPTSTSIQNHQIFCCAFNANGTIFVTGSSDTLARVWSAFKSNSENPDQPNHEIDVLAGHENDVNYVQFSGCAVASRFITADTTKEDSVHKFKNSWFTHDNIVTCSRDGSAIIWVPRSRRSHGKAGRWTRAYHLKVPPPPMPPQPPRGGPRQRNVPTPRGVNMIIWSLDNRFVLAAIMDCRICVWNASDGSLVHSLTGHTQSTYVLDVHPFNPRIAMSAGYDGKTIVWDIWEGMPIQIHDVSRFRMVDGKFSPDGTSIILSDDVGQLYIISTGQGESKKDAQYDQFFLGDYRPLIQDTYGNAVDQETQLVPYRRNMQDLLCDSAMIPYPEPYQSTYQRRRLGALGLEWQPSSLKLAIGPDFNLDPEFQMLPLADLDLLVEPLPEFLDAMDWEPEIEVHTDDTDSEYNVTEDCSTGGEQGSLNSNSSIGSECSAEDTGDEDAQADGLRRSKRKKKKAEIEIMTSSGRRIKRRNLDECDENPIRSNRSRKSRIGRNSSKMKSASKSSRPRRVAARNALHLFSKLKGPTSSDIEDEDCLGSDLSDSDSTLQDSNIESDESVKSLQNTTMRLKGKQVSLGEAEEVDKPHDLPESHVNAGNRMKLVFKLPNRNWNKHVSPETIMHKCFNQIDVVGSSSKSPWEVTDANHSHANSQEAEYSIEAARARRLAEKVDGHLNWSFVSKNGNIRWGSSRARTSKRLRVEEVVPSDACPRSSSCLNGHGEKESGFHENLEAENKCSIPVLHPMVNDYGNGQEGRELSNLKDRGCDTSEGFYDRTSGKEPLSIKHEEQDESLILDHRVPFDTVTSSSQNGTEYPIDECKSTLAVTTKIRLKANIDAGSSQKNETNGVYDALPGSPQHLIMHQDDVLNNNDSDDRNDGSRESDALEQKNFLLSQTNKMYSAVYRRMKSHKGMSNLEVDGSATREISSSLSIANPQTSTDGKGGIVDGVRRTRSQRLKISTHTRHNVLENLKSDGEQELEDTSRAKRCLVTNEHRGPSSTTTVCLRSTRNRRHSINARDRSPIDRRKSLQSARKVSWLMMSEHERGSRYIPQLGDEVVYLRQGHQEYMVQCGSRLSGPWRSMSGTIRAVEFCKVVKLEYSSSAGSGDSCCKMTLEFIDPASDVYGQSFKLTLPEVTSFPDFLVERTQYDASLHRNWSCRDKCKVWWQNEDDADGSWWDGRITRVMAKSSEFPDSPWDMYEILYNTAELESHHHSPWELYDADFQWEPPRIDDESKLKLLSAFKELQSSTTRQDHYGVQETSSVSQRPQFKNRFPVPLTLELIESRLQNDYYRSLEALRHDTEVMLTNFESYSAKNEKLSRKVKRLSDWFARTLSSL